MVDIIATVGDQWEPRRYPIFACGTIRARVRARARTRAKVMKVKGVEVGCCSKLMMSLRSE